MFWVAYEQSAYLVFLSKGYKPIKKLIKNCDREVVTIGFPTNALEQWIQENNIEVVTRNEKIIKLQNTQTFVNNEYLKWKNDMPVKSKKKEMLSAV